MKINIAFPALFLFTLAIACKKSNSSTPSASDVNLKKGLLAYFPFDGNMADSSGNGNATTAVGGATLTYDEHGYANSAFGGTGNGERILVTNNGSIKFDTAFTVSYNFMVRSLSKQAFLSMVINTTGIAPSFITGINTSNVTYLDFGAVDSAVGCTGSGAGYTISNVSSFTPQPESWYNYIAIYHKGVTQIYVNGKLISSLTGASNKADLCPDAQLVIGGWWQNDPISINGKLDDIRLYNRVLNADEIAELAQDFQATN